MNSPKYHVGAKSVSLSRQDTQDKYDWRIIIKGHLSNPRLREKWLLKLYVKLSACVVASDNQSIKLSVFTVLINISGAYLHCGSERRYA